MPKPVIEPYERHALMCCGETCGGNRMLFQYLKKRLAEQGLNTKLSSQVRTNRAACLGVCCEGAIMVVYPEGVWYCHLDEAGIDRIIEEHFKAGQVVEDLCFHGVADTEV